MRTFQKTMFTVVLATTFATLAFPNNANAMSVVCVAGGGCVHSILSCEDRWFEIYRKGGYHAFNIGVGCGDYKIAGKPTGSILQKMTPVERGEFLGSLPLQDRSGMVKMYPGLFKELPNAPDAKK